MHDEVQRDTTDYVCGLAEWEYHSLCLLPPRPLLYTIALECLTIAARRTHENIVALL